MNGSQDRACNRNEKVCVHALGVGDHVVCRCWVAIEAQLWRNPVSGQRHAFEAIIGANGVHGRRNAECGTAAVCTIYSIRGIMTRSG